MTYNIADNFEELRLSLALKAVVTPEQVDMDRRSDMNANPYNDSYGNKPERRSDAQIISDRSFVFADEFMKQQYGSKYQSWLNMNTTVDPHRNHIRRFR